MKENLIDYMCYKCGSCTDQLQMKDLRHALYSHGNYTLTPDFAAFTVPHAVWQVKSQEDKDAAF